MDIIFLIIGAVLGIIIGWLLQRLLFNSQKSDETNKFSELEKEILILEDRNKSLLKENEQLSSNIDKEREKSENLSNRIARAEVEYRNLQEKLETQTKELEQLQEKFKVEFENIANRILKRNSQEFTDTNQKNISEILSPLKEKIEKFEKKVEETYKDTLKDQTDLKAELKKIYDLSSKLSEGTNNLTKALKGDFKKQGNWGELVLEKILERSGLIKGEEYETQQTTRNEQGELIKPDVIIHLPDNKHIIIDSKVSLVAYDAYVNTEDTEEKEKYLKLHITAVRNHIKGLSDKSYQNASLFNAPDFVLLFIPIESSFSIAVQADLELFNYAWDRKIVIVSPSTLLATLKTVESIWKQEKQTRHAQEIAIAGGNLYDKFVGFLSDFEKINNQLSTVQKTYNEAHKKLSSGTGDIITRIEKLRKLGAKNTKSIPEKYIDQSEE